MRSFYCRINQQPDFLPEHFLDALPSRFSYLASYLLEAILQSQEAHRLSTLWLVKLFIV